MTLPAQVGLYWRTVRHLRPEQLVHRVRLRAQQEVIRRRPGAFERRWMAAPVGPPTWPDDFRAVDAQDPPYRGSLEDLAEGTFTFLEERRELGRSIAWDPPDASQLWLFHLHYWEWAWALAERGDAAARDLFAHQWRSWWAGTRLGRWNAWAPYPASLRAWVIVNTFGVLAAGSDVEADVVDHLRLHAGFLADNLELDVGGNHLLKNLKALVGLGVFLGREDLVTEASRRLALQIPVQVLPDGGHYERSPSYHCQVLGDLIDVSGLLAATGHPPVPGLDEAVARMRAWLGAMLLPDGDVPLLNDAELVGARRVAVLAPAPAPAEPLSVLGSSGYVVARSARLHLVADVGDPCPPDLPGHAHADCLSFELSVDGRRFVVDPGTSLYGSGPQRRYERSTRAHNTVTVDGVDQTEVWAGFRAGRLAHGHLVSATADDRVVEIVGEHDGYRHLAGSPVHRRRWTLHDDQLVIEDVVHGSGTHVVEAHLLLAREPTDEVDGSALAATSGAITTDGVRVVGPRTTSHAGSPTPAVGRSTHAVGFGRTRPAVSLRTERRLELPVTLCTTVELDAPPPPGRVLQDDIQRPIIPLGPI